MQWKDMHVHIVKKFLHVVVNKYIHLFCIQVFHFQIAFRGFLWLFWLIIKGELKIKVRECDDCLIREFPDLNCPLIHQLNTESSLPLSHGDTGLTSTRVSVKPRLQQGVNSYVTKSSTLHLIQFHWTHHKPKTALHIYLKPTCLISMNFLFPPKAYVHPMLNGPYVKGKNSGKLLGRTLSN